MSDWQPIETAPKDGRSVLLSDGVHVTACWWNADANGWRGGGGTVEFWDMAPTHWMPLPEPPKENKP